MIFFIGQPNMRKSFSLAFFFFPLYFPGTKHSLNGLWVKLIYIYTLKITIKLIINCFYFYFYFKINNLRNSNLIYLQISQNIIIYHHNKYFIIINYVISKNL